MIMREPKVLYAFFPILVFFVMCVESFSQPPAFVCFFLVCASYCMWVVCRVSQTVRILHARRLKPIGTRIIFIASSVFSLSSASSSPSCSLIRWYSIRAPGEHQPNCQPADPDSFLSTRKSGCSAEPYHRSCRHFHL